MLRRVLVANRGEIAVRVIRTCRRLGIETVLTVSDADAGSLPARLADQVIRIGPAPAADSYLNVDAVVGAAVAAGVGRGPPGLRVPVGERAAGPGVRGGGDRVHRAGPETLEAAGDKLAAREHAVAAGLPVLPGGHVVPGGPRVPGLAGDAGDPAASSEAAAPGGTAVAAAEVARPDRVSGAGQGGGGRRGAGAAGGAGAG